MNDTLKIPSDIIRCDNCDNAMSPDWVYCAWCGSHGGEVVSDGANEADIEKAAAAIANARGGRRGAPPITNILDVLQKIVGGKLYDEVMEDARAALEAVNEQKRKP